MKTVAKINNWVSLVAVLFSFSVISCTSEDMEQSENLNYRGNIELEINRDCDSLYILADRIVKTRTYVIALDAKNGGKGSGRFIYGKPSYVKENKNLTSYPVGIGDYILSGIGCSYNDFEQSYMEEIRQGKGSTELKLSQHIFYANDNVFQKQVKKYTYMNFSHWTDYNGYAPYVLPLEKPLYATTSEMLTVEKDSKTTFPLNIEKRSLTLSLSFNIGKDLGETPFIINNVVAELSGIPNTLDIHSGLFDFQNTYKVFVPISFNSDGYYNEMVSCTGITEITSIALPKSPAMSLGPGILQLQIYVTTEDGSQKVMYGKINLYNSIRKADIVAYTEDGDYLYNNKESGILNIEADCIINSSHIISDEHSVTGIDHWERLAEEIIVDTNN